MYTQIQQAVFDELQIIPLDYQPAIWAMQEDVTGLEVNSINTIWLNHTGFTGQCPESKVVCHIWRVDRRLRQGRRMPPLPVAKANPRTQPRAARRRREAAVLADGCTRDYLIR